MSIDIYLEYNSQNYCFLNVIIILIFLLFNYFYPRATLPPYERTAQVACKSFINFCVNV